MTQFEKLKGEGGDRNKYMHGKNQQVSLQNDKYKRR